MFERVNSLAHTALNPLCTGTELNDLTDKHIRSDFWLHNDRLRVFFGDQGSDKEVIFEVREGGGATRGGIVYAEGRRHFVR